MIIMKQRKRTACLLDKMTLVEKLNDPVTLPITTYTPGKWALVDMETGNIWMSTKRKQPTAEIGRPSTDDFRRSRYYTQANYDVASKTVVKNVLKAAVALL